MISVNAARAMRVQEGYGLDVGDRGDLVVLASPNVRTAVADQAPRRFVVSHGRLACEHTVTSTRHPRP